MISRYSLILLLLAGLLVPYAAQAQTFFTGRFSAAQETHDVTSDASGTAAVVLTEEGVRFLITVSGLSGPITAAHFHQGIAGADGPPVRTITDAFDGTSADGSWTTADAEALTPEMIRALYAGGLYLNVHTAANPAGEIRAQLYPSAGTGLTASLTAAQNGVESDAAGTAALQATEAGVAFYVTASGLSGAITAAHFHQGAASENGPPVRTITDAFDGTTAFGLWTTDDAEPLTDAQVATLLTGGLYLNVHTAANPAGEIRGQVLLDSGWSFSADLDADQSGTDVEAGGTASLTLTDAGLAFRLTVEGLSGPITAAHFHQGAAGTTGPPVRTITDDFDGATASGLWTADDAEPLTANLVQALLSGGLYLNIHTAANPAGEIRGQVVLDAGASLTAALTPAQSGTDVEASGTANLTVTDAGVAYRVTASGLSGAITAAHFHQGAAGTAGPPVRTITDGFAGKTVTLVASKDNTLYEDPAGALSNGSGEHFFAGRTNQAENSIRRGLLAFDVASALPPGAVVESVELTMNMSMSQAGAMPVSLHRATTDWGEGASVAGGGQGSGTEPTMDDATWVHTFFDMATWATPGGDFDAASSASTDVAADSTYTWGSTDEMVADVQGWLDDPASNFGWLVQGNEGASATAKRFDSRESSNPPTLTVTYAAPSGTATGLWTAADDEPLTSDLVEALLSGDLYLNVHTAANPAGEIRGQVVLDAGTHLVAGLTAAQNGIDADAAGSASLTLTDAGAAFRVTVEGLSGAITAAHFHQGAAGTAGPPVRTITDDFDGATATGLWTAADAEPLTGDLVEALLSGDLYLNVHTAANPAGEIRGQVRVGDGVGSALRLDPEQSTSPVTSDGRGTSALTLTDAGLVFALTADGLTGPLTAAHLHQGAAGTAGPPVRTITDDFDGATATGLWTAADAEPLTTDLLGELFGGNLYLNLHTAANPGGEIRGQLYPNRVVVTALDPVDAQVPDAFALGQNYPNPFNPQTTITFDLARSSHAVLNIFNVLGQQVATLVDRPLTAGQYQVTFDAAHLPSGIYLYRLEADGRQQTRRMLLLK